MAWVSEKTGPAVRKPLTRNVDDKSTLMVLDSTAGRQMEEVFRRRPWTRRIAEWAANQIVRLL